MAAATPSDGTPRSRDRDASGRPEQQRPRDRTGRPLAYDTTETALTEQWECQTVEEALAFGVWLWDRERYFEAHECLEDVWHNAPDGERDFWQGVVQIAVACVHHQRDNPLGVQRILTRARRRLTGYPDVHHGVDVAALVAFADTTLAALEAAGDHPVEIGCPRFPAMDDGPWFDVDVGALDLDEHRAGAHPPLGATPVGGEPAWRQPPRGADQS